MASSRDTAPCDMGGFTRLLHTGRADDLMDEIPTLVTDTLPGGRSESYSPINRPYAFLQWLDAASIPERYILMAEPDQLFIRPMPNLMHGDQPAAAGGLHYMPPSSYKSLVRKFLGPVSDEEIAQVPLVGCSPSLISVHGLRRVAARWLNTSIAIFDDAEARSTWGWVQEMFGYRLATYRAGVHQVRGRTGTAACG